MASIVVDKLVMTLTFDCADAMRDIESAHSRVMRIDPHCCFVGCPAPAVVAIHDTRPETNWEERETHACADHVRELGGEESYAIVEKFGQVPPVINDVARDAGRRAAAHAWATGEHEQAALESIELAERKAVKERLTIARPSVIHVTNAGPVRDVDAAAASPAAYEQLRSAMQRMLTSEE